MYASPAWWEFATAADKQRIEAFVRRGVRLGLYLADDPTPAELSADSDDNLFECILSNNHHVLNHLQYLTRLITNTIFETAVTIAHCVLKPMRKTF